MTEENAQQELTQVQEDLVDELPNLIRLFHLTDGTIILATIENYTSEYAMLWRAFVINRAYDAMGNLLGFDMQPYLNDLIDEDELVPLNLSLVFAVVPPSLDLMKYYIATSLIPDGFGDDEDEDDSGAEEYLMQEENKTEQVTTKKRTLH